MKNKITLSLMALGLALPVANLQAQDGPRPLRPRDDSREEHSAPRPGPTLFGAIDQNSDGLIDRREFAEAMEALHRRPDGPQRRGPGMFQDGNRAERPERRGFADRVERPERPERAERPGRPEHPERAERRERLEHRERMDRRDGPEGGPRRFAPPLIAALDANHDGILDESEIDRAPAALRELDRNEDGKLTREELRPGGPRAGRRFERRERFDGPDRAHDGERGGPGHSDEGRGHHRPDDQAPAPERPENRGE